MLTNHKSDTIHILHNTFLFIIIIHERHKTVADPGAPAAPPPPTGPNSFCRKVSVSQVGAPPLQWGRHTPMGNPGSTTVKDNLIDFNCLQMLLYIYIFANKPPLIFLLGEQPSLVGTNPRRGCLSAKLYLKPKELGPVGGGGKFGM